MRQHLILVLQEVLSQQKAQASNSINQEVDLDELMDVSGIMHLCHVFFLMHLFIFTWIYLHGWYQDPELERLHADRIAALKVRIQSLWNEPISLNIEICGNLFWEWWSIYPMIYLIERSWEATGFKEARAWRIQGGNWGGLLGWSHWEWKSNLPLLPSGVLPMQVKFLFILACTLYSHMSKRKGV